MGQIANRQSLVFSERGQLSPAIPQFHAERILHQWTPIARFESQRNARRAYEDQILCFQGRYELQRTLAIRIAAITLASPKGPNLEEKQSRLKLSISLENVKSRLKTSISTFRIPHKYQGLGGWLAWNFQSRLKFSILEGDLQLFNVSGKWKVLIFSRVWSFDPHALLIFSADDLGDFPGIL